MLLFLHGHGGVSWHTKCEPIFARSTYYYRQSAKGKSKHPSVLNHTMTLTRLQPWFRANLWFAWGTPDNDANDEDITYCKEFVEILKLRLLILGLLFLIQVVREKLTFKKKAFDQFF